MNRSRLQGPSRLWRALALALCAILGASFAAVMATPAAAVQNQGGTTGNSNNVFYAYVQVGESLSVSGPTGTQVLSPTGVMTGIGMQAVATSDGIWTVTILSTGNYNWKVEVLAAGVVERGRVWTNIYTLRQTANIDLTVWVVNDAGYQYEVELDDYYGLNSRIRADTVGNPIAGTCTPWYRSVQGQRDSAGWHAIPDCGGAYRIFFEAPSEVLPAQAESAAGTVAVLPAPIGESDLAVSDMAFTPTAPGAPSGTLNYSIDKRFTGGYWLEIEVDGDGDYNGPLDRREILGADGTGTYSYAFDGLDSAGDPLDSCTQAKARVYFDRVGEVHIVQDDVERRPNGIAVTRLNGPNAPDSTLYWNDTFLPNSSAPTPIKDGTAGFDSSAGVHGWTGSSGTWGDQRNIEDWAYAPFDFGTGEIALSKGTFECVDIVKTSDASAATRIGDVVNYTVTATNTASTDLTSANPVVVFDDLSAVLDDADFNSDATATINGSVVGSPSFVSPLLSWQGALPAGASVELSYSVTVTAAGDRALGNVAWAPIDPLDPVAPACVTNGVDPVTGEPCGRVEALLPALSISKSASSTELPAIGAALEYTVTVTNEGPGAYTAEHPASMSDDLSEVLDDAEFLPGSLTASTGTAAIDGDELSWSGALAAGESAIIRYSVEYTGAGDRVLSNSACLPTNEAANSQLACRTVQVPGSGLLQSKIVDPESGTPVVSGQSLTYTLLFENVGGAAAAVQTVDDLSELLDDATIVVEPVSSNPAALTAVRTGNTIAIDGLIPANETVTVSYTVVVKDFAEQGDHIVSNTLQCAALDSSCEATTTENPVRHITVTKTSDAASGVDTGDVVGYTVTVQNDGAADYDDAHPASASDDLSAVLDDATYNDDATPASVSYVEPLLSWTGALAAGEAVELKYSVTATNEGDHLLRNTAQKLCEEGELCTEPPAVVDTPLPHVVAAKSSVPESGSDLLAGDVVSYTLSFTNDGQAAGVVDSSDDLSDVLDDGDVTSAPVASNAAVTATISGNSMRVEGPIAAGETVTVSYEVAIKPDGERGNNRVGNVLAQDTVQLCDGEICPDPSTEHFVGELDDWKTVDPASGATVQPGQEISYTLHFANTGEANVPVNRDDVLTAVLDDATITAVPVSSDPALVVSEIVDGRFAVTGTLAPGAEATVTYTVRVNPDGERGDDRIGNVLVASGEQPPAECVVSNPERPDCTVNHVSNVTVAKSSDPESGSAVRVGDSIRYTLTFVNVSKNAAAADVAVDYTDHMVDVLDDARLSGEPTSSDAALDAVVAGDTIRIEGVVASGETVTVSYTVTVKDYAAQGNHRIGNVVAVTGEEPVCAPDSPLCTTHEAIKPAPGLASTGAEPLAALLMTLLLIAGGGAALMFARRRTTDA